MKYLLLFVFAYSLSQADMLFNNDRCITAYSLYQQNKKYRVKYSSNPTVWIKTNKLVSNTPISNDIYVLKYDSNGNEVCIVSKAKQLGMTEQDYNFTMSILGGLFGLSVFTLILKAV